MKLRQKQEHKELVDLDQKAQARIAELMAKFEREKQVIKIFFKIKASHQTSDVGIATRL